MSNPVPPRTAVAVNAPLEQDLLAVELRLAALGEALRCRDAEAIDTHATELHRALARAVHGFALAARGGAVPLLLRQRLAAASGQMAAQRESLARATAALDRAIDVLMPPDGVYSARGGSDRNLLGGSVIA
ncbi:MAG: hypothetical protein JWP52_2410 [Rhizobacter sp.]|nr:hypothetical protein [Rhizobacter sp.]